MDRLPLSRLESTPVRTGFTPNRLPSPLSLPSSSRIERERGRTRFNLSLSLELEPEICGEFFRRIYSAVHFTVWAGKFVVEFLLCRGDFVSGWN